MKKYTITLLVVIVLLILSSYIYFFSELNKKSDSLNKVEQQAEALLVSLGRDVAFTLLLDEDDEHIQTVALSKLDDMKKTIEYLPDDRKTLFIRNVDTGIDILIYYFHNMNHEGLSEEERRQLRDLIISAFNKEIDIMMLDRHIEQEIGYYN